MKLRPIAVESRKDEICSSRKDKWVGTAGTPLIPLTYFLISISIRKPTIEQPTLRDGWVIMNGTIA